MKLAHEPLREPEVIAYINTLFPDINWQNIDKIKNSELDTAWRDWLTNSKYNRVIGLEQFTHSAFCPGTTDAFGEFLSRYPSRRIRVSRSDFVLTKILSKTFQREFLYLEEEVLHTNDCVVMSMPFSGNGSKHPAFDLILDQADFMGVPVFVDAAYFGISHNIEYPLHRACIRDFTLSLSKNMAGNPLRLGIRFTKDLVDDGITAGLIGSDIFDRLGAYISIKLLNRFSHAWLIEKYNDTAIKICTERGLTPTNTITLAIGQDHMIEYKRGDYVRICISDDLVGVS
jgi:hypothetical protein